MEHGVSPGDYKDFILFLATAGVVVPLFKRLRISPILGFLGAGVALGPYGLGALAETSPWLGYFTVANPEDIAVLAELGVVFLLFMIGLELSWDRLRLLRRLVFGLGTLQVVLCAAAVAALLYVAGAAPGAALICATALALSSTAIVVPVLGEQKRMHSPVGRAAFSVLLFQDLAVAPILIALALLSGEARGLAGGPVLTAVQAVGGVVLVLLVGRLLLRPMFKSVARAKSEELFMATCLLVVIGAGLLTALAGLSMALGAFLAGLLLAETEYRHEVEVTIEPFKGLFLGLFFVSMGIGLDLSALAAQPVLVVGLAVGFLVSKALIVTGLARGFGLKPADAMETGLLLGAGGEFAFVIMSQAMAQRVVPSALGEAVLMSAGLSMFLIPLLGMLGRRLNQRVTGGRTPEPDVAPEPPAAGATDGGQPVLVVGYGRVGILVGELLDRHQLRWVAIDRDPRLVEQGRRRNHTVFFGEASRVEFLNRCGLAQAKAVVVTMDSPEAVEAVVASAREARPDIVIVARARDARHAKTLYALGATEAVPETIEASLQLSESLLVDIGVPMGLVIASIHEMRDAIRQDLNRPEALGGRVRRARDRLGGGA